VRYLVGIGNYYGFDDSIGLRVAEAIGDRGLDRGFRAIDLGGNLIDLAHYLGAEVEQVLIVDSARMGRAPGEFAFFTPDAVTSRKRTAGFSTHEADLLKVLGVAASLREPLAPITILGIEPAEVANEPGLSAPLAERFDEYIDAAVSFLTM
jgi:hydrogenase maturation protease